MSPRNVIISTIKKAEDSEDMIVRLFEIEGSECKASISFFKPVMEAWRANAIEEKIDSLDYDSDALKIKIRAFEILTLRMTVGT